MGVKQGRKLDELSVDGPAFQSVLEQAMKRQAARLNLRAMIDQAGMALRDMVIRPGEIQRMVKDYRDELRAKGDPGADEQAAELEAMLVEIRRRVEEGTLRFSRKVPARSTADTVPAQANAEIAGGADAAKPGQGKHGGSAVGQRESSEEEDRQPETSLGAAAPQQADPEVVPAGSPADGDGQGRSEAPILPPELEIDESEGGDPYSRGCDPDDEADEDGRRGLGRNGWPSRGGPDGEGDRYAD